MPQNIRAGGGIAATAMHVGQGACRLGRQRIGQDRGVAQAVREQSGGDIEFQPLVTAQAEGGLERRIFGCGREPRGEVAQGSATGTEAGEVAQEQPTTAIAADARGLGAGAIQDHEGRHGLDTETVGQHAAGGSVQVEADEVEIVQFGTVLRVGEDLPLEKTAGPAPGGREVDENGAGLAGDEQIGGRGVPAPR